MPAHVRKHWPMKHTKRRRQPLRRAAKKWTQSSPVASPKRIKTIAATRSAAIAKVHGVASEAAAAIVERLTGIAPASEEVNEAVSNVALRKPIYDKLHKVHG